MELEVRNTSGEKTGSASVPEGLFVDEVPLGLLHQVVRWQRAKKRVGTHTVKTRSEVRGGGKKPWKQKGTGRARAGSSSSPIWVGGGVAHGPKQRSYQFQLNKRERELALRGAMSLRQEESRLLVFDEYGLKEIKTRAAAEMLNTAGVAGSALVVLEEGDETVAKSMNNLPRVKTVMPQGLNVYDILAHEYLLMSAKSLESVAARFVPSGEKKKS